MARLQKHRLPNHFGSIRFLGTGRRNAYAVHAPEMRHSATDQNESGNVAVSDNDKTKRKTICYTSSWEEGYQVLVLFHAGVITGDESQEEIIQIVRKISGVNDPDKDDECPRDKMIDYARKMLVDLELIQSGVDIDSKETTTKECEADGSNCSPRTFRQVYESFLNHRFGPNASQKRKKSTKNGYNSAWLKLEPFYNLTLDQTDVDTLESRVNLVAGWGYSKTTVQRMVTLIHQLYKYAYDRGYCTSRHGLGVEMPAAKEELHHQDFTDRELGKLWEVYNDVTTAEKTRDVIRMILIMCYSGFRIQEYETLDFVDGEVPYFRGGL